MCVSVWCMYVCVCVCWGWGVGGVCGCVHACVRVCSKGCELSYGAVLLSGSPPQRSMWQQ